MPNTLQHLMKCEVITTCTSGLMLATRFSNKLDQLNIGKLSIDCAANISRSGIERKDLATIEIFTQ